MEDIPEVDVESDSNAENLNETTIPNGNLNCSDVDKEMLQKLRGDAIGNTLYSESFVAKTLLQLCDLQWSEKVEEDLCFLWDMTLEKDVCDYLLKLSYPGIACAVISKHDESRLVEIVIGIMANICCITDTIDIANEHVELILSVLNSDDTLVLIQVVRFIKAMAYSRLSLPFIDSVLLEKLNFILSSSTNNDLLLNALDAVSKITADNKLEINLINGEIVKSSIAAYQTIYNNERERLLLDEDQIETNHQRTALTHLIQIISNVCYYINFKNSDSLFEEVNRSSELFLNEILKVFKCYSKDETLLPVYEVLQFYTDALIFIFQVLNVRYSKEILTNLFKITNILLKNEGEDALLFLELDCYFIFKGKLEELKSDLAKIPTADAMNVLKKIKTHKLACEFSHEENLNALLKEYETLMPVSN